MYFWPLILLSSALINGACSRNLYNIEKTVAVTELFVIPLKESMFDIPDAGYGEFSYSVSIRGAADLPYWIRYTYSKHQRSGYLYGVAPRTTDIELDVVVFNEVNFEVHTGIILLQVRHRVDCAQNEVEVKILNMEVEDLIVDMDRHIMSSDTRLDKLKRVFTEELWPESKRDMYITYLVSALELGGRKPTDPNLKDGVIVRVGSGEPFSDDMLRLETEAKLLYKHSPCPRHFKKTSGERYFRYSGFQVDWCDFKLLKSNLKKHGDMNPISPAHMAMFSGMEWNPPRREDIPIRDYTHESILTLMLPIVSAILLVSLLSFLMCLNKEGPARDGPTPDIQMIQYDTVGRPPDSLRTLSHYRAATPVSTTSSIRRPHRPSDESYPEHNLQQVQMNGASTYVKAYHV